MKSVKLIVCALAVAAFWGCASEEGSADRRDRASSAVETCRDHGGVIAIEDDAVICEDQSFSEERGERAVTACRGHGGVSGFDDDIVICRDQTFHEVEEQ